VTFLDDLGLRAAERLETSVGPWVALASYRRLLAPESAVRGRAAFGVVRCATALGDETAIIEALPALVTAKDERGLVLGHVRDLLASGRTTTARRLAEAEQERRPRARAVYAVALATDKEADGDVGAWDRAERQAFELGAREVAARAGAFYAHRALRGSAPLDRARLAQIGERSEPACVPAELRVWLARARLASTRRFQRAAALSTLEEIVRTGNDGLRRAALRAVAAHVDGLAYRLEDVELDRAGAALAKGGDPALRDRGGRLFAELRASRAVDANPADAVRRVDESDASTIETLTRLAAKVSPDAPLAPFEWVAARRALGAASEKVREAGATLVSAALERTLGVPPFSSLTLAQELGGATGSLAFSLEAVRWNEPGARRHLAFAHRSRAHAALAKGDRKTALSELLASRAAFERVGGAS